MSRIKEAKSKEGSHSSVPGILLWPIFLATLTIVILCLIPALFPALLLRMFGGYEDYMGINPFEIGIWTTPLLITNFIVFGLLILYHKNKLGNLLTKAIRFIFHFEISKSLAFLIITILIGFYITFSVGELTNEHDFPDYLIHVKPWLEIYSLTNFENTPLSHHLQLFLEQISMQVFGNYKVTPFLASISLLVLTYIFTAEITKKRFAGIVAMVIVLQSYVFLMYDTSVAYPNFWVLFFLLSLYLILKKWTLSHISYIASLLSKPLSLAFLPMTLHFIYKSEFTRKKKILVVIPFIVMLAALIAIPNDLNSGIGSFENHDFWSGFSAAYFALRYDGLVLVFLLPLIIGLFIASRNGIRYADSIMFMIMGILALAPFLEAFTGVINVPYRFIPLVVFFAIGTGVLLSKRITK